MPDEDELGSRNHEDAIYPTTKLSMINTALNARGHILQEPAEQEARTKLPHGIIDVLLGPCGRFSVSSSSVPDTNDKNPNLVRASHPAGNSRLTSPRQFGRFRGKRLNIELGSQVVNSGQIYSSWIRKNPPNRPSTSRVLLRHVCLLVFNNPSSEVIYTAL